MFLSWRVPRVGCAAPLGNYSGATFFAQNVENFLAGNTKVQSNGMGSHAAEVIKSDDGVFHVVGVLCFADNAILPQGQRTATRFFMKSS